MPELTLRLSKSLLKQVDQVARDFPTRNAALVHLIVRGLGGGTR